ncbi:MAG: hypothetical protein WBM54_08530 [Woeseia sp.]
MIFRDNDAIRRQLLARQQELEDLIDLLRGKTVGDRQMALSGKEDSELIDTIGNDATGELLLVRAILNRLDDGSYGQCTKCAATISDERLADFPYALLCAPCANAAGGESGEHKFNRLVESARKTAHSGRHGD